MAFDITGKLVKIYDVESKSASFQTREFVITTEETYPQFIKFQSVQDRVTIVEGYNVGDKVKVFFDLRGREWQEKYFTNLNAWKVERVADAAPASSSAPAAKSAAETDFPPFEPDNNSSSGSSNSSFTEFDDLPF